LAPVDRVISTWCGAVGDAGVVDTLEAWLEDTRRRHEANEYRPNLPLAVIEAGIRSVWAEEHPARQASLRLVNNEGVIDVGVNAGGDQVGSNAGGTSRQRGVIHADEVSGVQAQGMQSSAAAGSSQGDVGGRRSSLSPMSATHVTEGGISPSNGYFKFTPDRISIALKSCTEYLDAGHRAWHFIESTYQVTDALYIGQPEEQLSHIRMGEEETAIDYCNQARRILATMRMAGVHYSTASYLMHVIKGLTRSYNLLKRLTLAPGTRATLNEDSLASYILQDEAMQEAERPSELLAQVNYVALKSAKDSGRGGGSRRRKCWMCGDPNHLSFECPDRSDSDDNDAKGGRLRSGSCHPRRGRNQPRKEKQSTKSSTSAKDADSSAGGKGRDDKEVSCSLVGVVEPTISLVPEAGEDFQAMATAVQANPAVVLLDSGCSHHLMGTKEVFVDLQPSGDVKHSPLHSASSTSTASSTTPIANTSTSRVSSSSASSSNASSSSAFGSRVSSSSSSSSSASSVSASSSSASSARVSSSSSSSSSASSASVSSSRVSSSRVSSSSASNTNSSGSSNTSATSTSRTSSSSTSGTSSSSSISSTSKTNSSSTSSSSASSGRASSSCSSTPKACALSKPLAQLLW
ncbi:unnamed protein product, partial [Closterium sp. NIES-54]